jgi:hypothetical protein
MAGKIRQPRIWNFFQIEIQTDNPREEEIREMFPKRVLATSPRQAIKKATVEYQKNWQQKADLTLPLPNHLNDLQVEARALFWYWARLAERDVNYGVAATSQEEAENAVVLLAHCRPNHVFEWSTLGAFMFDLGLLVTTNCQVGRSYICSMDGDIYHLQTGSRWEIISVHGQWVQSQLRFEHGFEHS